MSHHSADATEDARKIAKMPIINKTFFIKHLPHFIEYNSLHAFYKIPYPIIILRMANPIAKLIKGIAGAIGIAGTTLLFSKIAEKRKNARSKTGAGRSLIASCNCDSLKKFAEDFTKALSKDFETMSASMEERESLRTLYESEIDLIGLFNEISIRQTQSDALEKGISLTSLKFLGIFAPLLSIASAVSIALAFIWKGAYDERLFTASLILSLVCFLISSIAYIVILAKSAKEKNKQIKIGFDAFLPASECERKFGKDFEALLERHHSARAMISERLSSISAATGRNLSDSILEIYCDLSEAAVRNSIRNVRGDVLPTMRLVLNDCLNVEAIGEFNDETKNRFEVRQADCEESYVLRPSIVDSSTGRTIKRGIYMKKTGEQDELHWL